MPIFKNLFHPSPMSKLNVRSFVNLLSVNFSEEGSNSRKFEKEVYGKFYNYVREVACKY